MTRRSHAQPGPVTQASVWELVFGEPEPVYCPPADVDAPITFLERLEAAVELQRQEPISNGVVDVPEGNFYGSHTVILAIRKNTNPPAPLPTFIIQRLVDAGFDVTTMGPHA